MKQPAYFTLVFSIFACLGFSVFLILEPAPLPPTMGTSFHFYEPVTYPVHTVKTVTARASLPDPFQPRFFATAQFKGVARNASDTLSAVFLDSSHRVFSLSSGQSIDGVTIIEIGSRTCKVLVGSLCRELSVK
jgi:hypothetical protein